VSGLIGGAKVFWSRKIKKCDERLQHIAFIMDGNGRWAKNRGLSRSAGHKAGVEAFKKVIRHCHKLDIKTVTVYAFSTENWKRDKAEVDELFRLLDNFLDEIIERRDENNNEGQIRFIGDISALDERLRDKIQRIERETRDGEYCLNIAINYGGRAEVVNAVNRAISAGIPITEEAITQNLYLSDEPDLIIRTANEKRLSNFLVWQGAYSEFYFCDTLWPSIGPRDVDKAVADFYKRKRKFGGY